MEGMLSKFQNDLGSISSEIQSLQDQSHSMSIKLKNRQVQCRVATVGVHVWEKYIIASSSGPHLFSMLHTEYWKYGRAWGRGYYMREAHITAYIVTTSILCI